MVDGRLALARLCAVQGRFNEAAEWFAKARTVLDGQGMRPLRAIADYDEGLMYVRRDAVGDCEHARPLLEAALRQFRALGMPGWIRRAEHLLREGTEWMPEAQPAEQPPPFDSAEDRPGPLLGKEGKPHTDQHARADTEPAAPAVNLFRKEAHFWTIAHAGSLVRLRDSKGLQYIAHLLHHSGQEFVALDLVLAVTAGGRPVPGGKPAPDPRYSVPVLDGEAKAAYKLRFTELREELQEAEETHDLGRIERARTEMDFISRELAAAVGLGGSDRAMGSDAERARSTVTKGIKSAIAKIGAAHPSAGRYLARTIRTGYFCAYQPDPDERISWQF
jgi:non-specific serine/threonine protein kinase